MVRELEFVPIERVACVETDEDHRVGLVEHQNVAENVPDEEKNKENNCQAGQPSFLP